MSAAPLEIAVLGRSTGESIVVRVSHDSWLVVDSFVSRRRPAAVRYIEYAGGAIKDIRWVVATHWDNDHVRGLAPVLAVAPRARFFSPAVADPDRLATLVAAAEVATEEDAEEHGADAYGQVLRQLALRGEPGALLSARTLLLRTDDVIVMGLSPTEWAVRRGMASVGRELVTDVSPGSAATAISPNLTSAVLWIETPTHRVLLGADLERHPEIRLAARCVRDR